jgi:hypothetical protein
VTWSDHTHSEYADHRHDHDIDYAPLHHRHYDLEREDDRLQALISGMGDALGELRGELQAAFDRICALEGANTRLTAALREAAGRHEDTLRAGLADEANLAIATELTETFISFSAALDGEPGPPAEEPESEPYDPGPEVDDEGGMSEYRYPWPEDYERGM